VAGLGFPDLHHQLKVVQLAFDTVSKGVSLADIERGNGAAMTPGENVDTSTGRHTVKSCARVDKVLS